MFSIQKKGNITDKILKALGRLEQSTVEVGHFAEQGNHTTAVKANGSPFSYVELMKYHHTGDNAGRPPRQPLEVLKIQNRNLSQYRWMKSAVRRSVSGVLQQNNLASSLDIIGVNLGKLEKNIFGDPELLAGTPYNTNPLVDTGELKSKVSYKNSITGNLKNASY